MRIYLVQATTNYMDYEPEHTWVVCAYIDEAKAEYHCEKAKEWHNQRLKISDDDFNSQAYIATNIKNTFHVGSIWRRKPIEYEVQEVELRDDVSEA